LEQGTSSPTTVSNDAPLSESWIPAWENEDWSTATSSSTPCDPVEYCIEKDSLVPAGIPAPHSLVAVPGCMQTSALLGTIFQPWPRSSESAPPAVRRSLA
jgi:hypothetical protein